MTRRPSRELRRRSLLAGLAGVTALAGCATAGDGDGTNDCGGTGGDGGTDGGSMEGGDDDGASPTGTGTAGSGEDGDGGENGDGGEAESGDPDTGDGTATRTPVDDLDLREANVTGVSVSASSGRSFRFDVTLYHDDDGEDGYANWWQVETRDGARLGRRELLHAHGTREFTRSDDIEVSGDVDCVVVRGHDETHGYGGQAALVRVSTGAVRFIGQGAERATLSGPCPGSG